MQITKYTQYWGQRWSQSVKLLHIETGSSIGERRHCLGAVTRVAHYTDATPRVFVCVCVCVYCCTGVRVCVGVGVRLCMCESCRGRGVCVCMCRYMCVVVYRSVCVFGGRCR